MVQVRNVPDAVHRKLKARAAEQGVSLSDFILAELKRVSEQISPQELAARSLAIAQEVEREGHPRGAYSIADMIREEREGREKHLGDLYDRANEPGGSKTDIFVLAVYSNRSLADSRSAHRSGGREQTIHRLP